MILPSLGGSLLHQRYSPDHRSCQRDGIGLALCGTQKMRRTPFPFFPFFHYFFILSTFFILSFVPFFIFHFLLVSEGVSHSQRRVRSGFGCCHHTDDHEQQPGCTFNQAVRQHLLRYHVGVRSAFLVSSGGTGHPQPSWRTRHPCTVDVLPGPTGVTSSPG